MEIEPEVIFHKKNINRESFEEKQLPGVWHRIHPDTSRDVMALRMLEHRREKFAPAHGNGVIISDAALRKFIK